MVKEQVKALIDGGQFSQTEIAAEIGRSGAALSQYLSNKYTGDNSKIEQSLQGFLNRQKHRKQTEILSYPEGIVKTDATETIRESALYAYQENEITIVYGDAGLGKSSGVHAFEFQNAGTIVITATNCYTRKVLFCELAEKLGENTKGSLNDIFNRLKNKLKNHKRMIIIDEAENLDLRTIDLLRSLHDQTKFALVFVGQKKIKDTIIEQGRGNEYIQSRIGMTYEISKMSKDDAKNILSVYDIDAKSALMCAEEMNYNARYSTKLGKMSKRLATINNREIDKPIITNARRLLFI